MADNFSLDDILAEIDAKKSVKKVNDDDYEHLDNDSVTSILRSEEIREARKSGQKDDKSQYSVTAILNDTQRKKDKTEQPAKSSGKASLSDDIQAAENKRKNSGKAQSAQSVQSAQSESIKKADEIKSEQPVKTKKKSESSTAADTGVKVSKPEKAKSDLLTDKKVKSTEDTSKTETSKKESNTQKKPIRKEKPDLLSAIAKKLTDPAEQEELKQRENKDEDQLAFPEEQKEKTQLFDRIRRTKPKEYDTQQRELINRQLQTEEELENPDELIDSLNPFEIKSKAADMGDVLSGDTMIIANDDLKKLAESGASPKASEDEEKLKLYQTSTDLGSLKNALRAENKEEASQASNSEAPTLETPVAESPTVESTAPVKEYIPNKEKAEEKPPQPVSERSEKDKRSNDALLEKLNISLSKQHKKEQDKKRTLGLSKNLSGLADSTDSLKAPTAGLNLDGDKIIEATGAIPDTDIAKENAKRKLRTFMMEGEEEEEEQDREDFESYDATGQIWSDLCESHKVIKLRFFILLAITLFMGFVALMTDLNNGMVFKLFGMDVTFLDRRVDVEGFLFYNMIMGVIAGAVCGSVLSGGLIKIFKLKADCDSLCAVTAVTSLLTSAANLINSDDVIYNYSYVLIPTAITGLLFNTIGKLIMITRAKRNFRFISGDGTKYSAIIVNEQSASALTKGVTNEFPYLAAMRKTELLTDFLKNSYCEDKADKLSRPLVFSALGAALLGAVIAYLLPYGIEGMDYNIYRALTVFTAILTVGCPFSVMFICNVPLTRACKALAKTDSVILGYTAAEEFSQVNSVMIDSSLLFPPGTVIYTHIKHCKQPNSINNISLDQAIILAASLAIKSGSIMSNMFKDVINDKEDILVKVENCVYEDNLGVLGWWGTKRLIMGSRDQMKRHDIKVPDMKKLTKYTSDNTETLYLSVGGEVVILFFVELLPNPQVKNSLQELTQNGVSIVVKTTDSIVTVSKLAEVFDIPPEKIRILPYSMHEQFQAFTHYVSRGNGALSCGGTFSGFSKALLYAKKLMKDISIGSWVMIIGAVIGIVCAIAVAWSGSTQLLCPSILTGWNILWLLIAVIAESVRKY